MHIALMSRRAWRFVLSWTPGQLGGQLGSLVTKPLVVRPGETASSADLGGSSKYSNENFED